MNNLPLVSVIFITYNRYELLKRTLLAFKKNCTYKNLELIVCDDGSPPEVQEKIRQLPFDVFLLADKNQGLGANCNKGLKAAQGDYIIQLQDDWDLVDDAPDFIDRSIEILKNNCKIGIIRYYKGKDILDRSKVINTDCGIGFQYFVEGQGYSDTPHLKRKTVYEQLGLYLENVPMTTMESDYVKRWKSQKFYNAVFYSNKNIFIHTGAESSFNPCQLRHQKLMKLKNTPVLGYFVSLYIFIRRCCHLLFVKVNNFLK